MSSSGQRSDLAAAVARGVSTAVVGHVEWVSFGRVTRLPAAGEVAHASGAFEEPAGGGGVAAVQLARLGGASRLFTVLGEDEAGRRSRSRLAELGVRVLDEAPARAHGELPRTRRAVTLLDDAGERTITTFGERLDPAGASGAAHWQELRELDAVYFTAGDVEALRRARAAARVLVASPRARHALGHGIPLDALVLSAEDEVELRALEGHEHEAAVVVYTEGARGGRYRSGTGEEGRWQAVVPPGPIVDSYGCGDSFAAGVTYGLGAGLTLAAALELGARCGAVCLTGNGPYGRQLTAGEVRGQPAP